MHESRKLQTNLISIAVILFDSPSLFELEVIRTTSFMLVMLSLLVIH